MWPHMPGYPVLFAFVEVRQTREQVGSITKISHEMTNKMQPCMTIPGCERNKVKEIRNVAVMMMV